MMNLSLKNEVFKSVISVEFPAISTNFPCVNDFKAHSDLKSQKKSHFFQKVSKKSVELNGIKM